MAISDIEIIAPALSMGRRDVGKTARDSATSATSDLGSAEGSRRAVSFPASPFAQLNANGTITLRLHRPFTMRLRSRARGVYDRRFEELVFHRITGGMIRVASRANTPSQQVAVFFAETLRLKLNAAAHLSQRLDPADAGRANSIFAYLLLAAGGMEGRADVGDYVEVIRAAWAEAKR